MKRRLFTVILSFTLAVSSLSGAANAAAKQDAQSHIVTEDVSDYILQEGGLLSAEGAGGNKLYRTGNKGASFLENDSQRNAADAVMAAWDLFQTECDLEKYHLTTEQVRELYPYLLNQFPRYFYLGKIFSWVEENGYVTKMIFDYKYSEDETEKMLTEYDTAVADVLKVVNPSWSEMEKALYFNDYLAANCEYDTTYSKFSAYDALVGKKAVCQGYSQAFQELIAAVGISGSIVSSESLNHAWNMVLINGSRYYVDVTWNDPIGNCEGKARHIFFLKSAEYFRSEKGEHLAEDDWVIVDGQAASDAKDTSYDNYFWNGIDMAFYPIDGFWYAFDGEEAIKKYAYSDGDFESIESIAMIDDIWPVIGSPGAFWIDKFVGTGSYDDKFYYSSSDKIYELDVKTKESKVIYGLTDEEKNNGSIWSIFIDAEGKLYYYWSDNPNSQDKVKKQALQLEITGTGNNDREGFYQIRFNGNGADSGQMKNMDSCLAGQTYSLEKNKFARSGYIFAGWNTKADGTGISYEDNAVVRDLVKQDYGVVVLYAQWKKEGSSFPDIDVTPPSDGKDDVPKEEEPEPSVPDETVKETKLSSTNLKVKKGKSVKLKLLNNTEKVSWKITSGKKYISLKNKTTSGVTIKGMKKGKAKVQAVVGKKKYTCTVKVV